MATSKPSSKKVSYFYHNEIGNFHYGNRPMKPHRMRMTDSIIRSYGLHEKMNLIDQNVRLILREILIANFYRSKYPILI